MIEMSGTILLLEDDDSIRNMIAINLKRNGFLVHEAATGEDAILVAALYPDIDIAILDIMLPGIDGIEVCHRIRSSYPFKGIIMLTAKTGESDKVNALLGGADDYITKPFSTAELIARVNSLLRRVKIIEGFNNQDKIISGPFEADASSRKLFKNGHEIELTPTEFSIVRLFMANPGRAIDRDEILNKVWGDYYFGELKIVDVNIRRIRKKIEDDSKNPRYIETVWGVGYRWKEGYNSEG